MGAVMSIPAKVNLCLYEIIRDLIIYYDIQYIYVSGMQYFKQKEEFYLGQTYPYVIFDE